MSHGKLFGCISRVGLVFEEWGREFVEGGEDADLPL